MDTAIKPEIPGFRLLQELGRGGSATVYLGEKADGSRFALKVFHESLAGQAGLRRRILGEWKAAAPEEEGFVRIHDFLETQGHLVLVMDYVNGESLAEFQTRLPFVLPEVSVLVAIEVLKALEGVHRRGIVHRDLKPSNVMVDKQGRVLLTDFGLAKWSDASQHTMHGVVLGSPDFMSPEQARGDVVTEQSDLFSLASVLYFLVTGTKAFSRPSPLATLAALVKGDFEPAGRRNPKISPALSRILLKGMGLQLKDRFSTASEFRAALEGYLTEIGFPQKLDLSAWLERPAESTMEALRAIAEKLAGNGRLAIDRGQKEKATEILSHLSLVAPDSLALVELLERLENSRRRRPFVWLGAVSALGLALLTFWFWPSPGLYPELPLAQAPTPVEIRSPAVAEVPVLKAPQADIPAPLPLAAKPPRKKAQLIRFDLPEGVEAEWNGISVPQDRPFRALPGVHQLILRKDGFQPLRRQIEVKADEPTVIKVN